jgi:hypothetical protein
VGLRKNVKSITSMKINKLHPYLPQEKLKLPVHPNLEREIREAIRRVQRAKREFEQARKDYLPVQKGVRPYTVKAIQITSRYRRSRRELTVANEALRQLNILKRYRTERK